jgi:hypothetical protein
VRGLRDARDASGIKAIPHPPLVGLCTDFAISAMGGLAAYRLASGFAHGKQWTPLASNAELPEGVDPDQAGPRLVTAKDDVSAVITACAVRTFEAAVKEFEIYTGKQERIG